MIGAFLQGFMVRQADQLKLVGGTARRGFKGYQAARFVGAGATPRPGARRNRARPLGGDCKLAEVCPGQVDQLAADALKLCCALVTFNVLSRPRDRLGKTKRGEVAVAD